MKKNNRAFRYVAGACFAGQAIFDLVWYGGDPYTLLLVAGLTLISVSMFASLPILTSAGAGLCAVVGVRMVITYWKDDYFPKRFLVIAILFLVFWMLLIVAGVSKKNAGPLGFVAGGVMVLRFAIAMIASKIDYGTTGLSFIGFIDWMSIIIGAFMIGMAFDHVTAKTSTGTSNSSRANNSAIPAESQIDRLTKLKGLLDSGIISLEEFETKKKQILGQ